MAPVPFSTIRARLDAVDLRQDASTSPLAGVAAPVGSFYSGPHGIPWLKTGTTSTAWTQQLLRAPYFNVKTYGAIGDGATNDRAAVQLAINAAIAAGGGVVFFPQGTYLCNLIIGTIGVFTLTGVAQGKILFLGCGRSSKVVMGGATGGDRRLFDVKSGCKYVGWKCLKMYSTISIESEQQHLIHFENPAASADLLTGDAYIVDNYFGYTKGDGIRFLGNDTKRVANILIKRNVFEMTRGDGARSRTCVSYQRATDDTFVDQNYLSGGSPIDMEPTGTGSLTKNHIMRNLSDLGEITLTGNDGDHPHIYSVFAYNTVRGARVSGLDVQHMALTSNIVDYNIAAASSDAPLGLEERIQDCVIADNILFREGPTLASAAMRVQNHVVGENSSLAISGNLCVDNTNVTDGVAISMIDCTLAVCSYNMCRVKVSASGNGNGILLNGPAGSEPAGGIVHGNMCLGDNQRLVAGVSMGSTNEQDTLACDNLIRHVISGTSIGNSLAAGNSYGVMRNVCEGSSRAVNFAGGTPLTYVAIEAQAGPVSPPWFQVTADPNTRVTAPLGSMALRSTGGGAGTSCYKKESDPTGNTGWVGL